MLSQQRSSLVRDSALRISALPQNCSDPRELATLIDIGCTEEPCSRADPNYRTSVRLNTEELTWLDCRCCELRRAGWHGISRSTLIRAVLSAVSDTTVSLWGVTNEEQLTEVLRRALGSF